MILHTLKNIKTPSSFAYKVACVDDKLSMTAVLYREKDAINKFIEKTLEEYDNYNKLINKDFNKNLVMSEKDKQRFQSSNK